MNLSKPAVPVKSKRNIAIDRLMYVVAFAYPLTTIPQIITIFSNQSAKDVSLTSWILYAVCAAVTLLYALSYKLKPLIVEGVLWTLMYAAVIAGILLYQ